MIDQVGGRKTLALIVVMLLGIGAVLIKGDVPTNFLTLVQWAFPLFIAGNGIEHMASAIASRGDAEPVDIEPLKAHIADLRADGLRTQEGVAGLQQILMEILKRFGQPRA